MSNKSINTDAVRFREAQISFYITYLEVLHITCYKSALVPLSTKWNKRITSKTFYKSFKNRAFRELSRPIMSTVSAKGAKQHEIFNNIIMPTKRNFNGRCIYKKRLFMACNKCIFALY